MYIEDDELRELYKASSSEHVQKLETDLMILEKNPQDTAAIEEFLREAHTLKGDSRMLGLDDIEMLVHHLESSMEEIKAGDTSITPELCDRLYLGIDAINQLAHQAITGETVAINTVEVLASLMGSSEAADSGDLFADDAESELFEDDLFGDEPSFSPSDSEETFSEAGLFDDEPLIEQPAVASIAPPEPEVLPTAKASQDYQIDTIRVQPEKLDLLMTQASELAVTKLRISQQMSEIERLITLWSGWQKQDQNLLQDLQQSLNPALATPLKQIFDQSEQKMSDLGGLINQLKTRAAEDNASLGIISDRLESGIQELRQLPLSTVFNLYPRMVRDLARQQGKDIELIIEGGDTKADKRILEEIKDPLLHLMRNAIDHGIETPEERVSQGKPAVATITLKGYQHANSIEIAISDDGRGLDLSSISATALRRKVRTEAELATMGQAEIQSLIFASGFSTRTEITELSGRGVGLDVVRANVERLKGSIQVDSTPGEGCKFQVRLNTSLATTKVLIIEVNRTLYALPLEFIQTMITLTPQDIYQIEGKQTINFAEQPLSVAPLSQLLQLPATDSAFARKNYFSCIVLQVTGTQSKQNSDASDASSQRFGILVDDLVDQQDIVQKPQSKLLQRIPNIAGATILGSGEVCMILNPADLLHSLRSGKWRSGSESTTPRQTSNRILLVEDSIIIRTQMQRLLQGAGYSVAIAENGLAGLELVQSQDFDLVLSDVEMPQMSGLEMTAKIRQNSQYDALPIVLITTLASSEDKRRGTEAGADAYLTKGDFDQRLLFQTLAELMNSKIR